MRKLPLRGSKSSAMTDHRRIIRNRPTAISNDAMKAARNTPSASVEESVDSPMGGTLK